MKTLVLYYSLSGVSRRVAEDLAPRLNADLSEIVCPRYRPGAIGYMRAAIDSLRGKRPEVSCAPAVSLGDYQRVVLCGPVWTSYLATPLRSALSRLKNWPDRVALLLTAGGQGDQATASRQAAEVLSRPLEAECRVTAADLKSGEAKSRIDRFVRTLT